MHTVVDLLNAIQDGDTKRVYEILDPLYHWDDNMKFHGYTRNEFPKSWANQDFLEKKGLQDDIKDHWEIIFEAAARCGNHDIFRFIINIEDIHLNLSRNKNFRFMKFMIKHSDDLMFFSYVNSMHIIIHPFIISQAICYAFYHNHVSKLNTLLDRLKPGDTGHVLLVSLLDELCKVDHNYNEALGVLLSHKKGKKLLARALGFLRNRSDELYEKILTNIYNNPHGISFFAKHLVSDIFCTALTRQKRNFIANLHVQLINQLDSSDDDTSICIQDYGLLIDEDNGWALNCLYQEHSLELTGRFHFGSTRNIYKSLYGGSSLALEFFLTLPSSGALHRTQLSNALSGSKHTTYSDPIEYIFRKIKDNRVDPRMRDTIVCLAVYIPEFKARLAWEYPEFYASLSNALRLVEVGYCLSRKGISKDVAFHIGQYVDRNARGCSILHGYHKSSVDRAELRRRIILDQEQCRPIGLFEQAKNALSNFFFPQVEEIFDDEEEPEFEEERQAIKKRRQS